jgi:hypothetical protein
MVKQEHTAFADSQGRLKAEAARLQQLLDDTGNPSCP